MRVDAVSVRNFRGLREAHADGLASSSMVTVSGPNGSGKSLLFEAMTFAWRACRGWPGAVDLRQLIGPWGQQAVAGLPWS